MAREVSIVSRLRANGKRQEKSYLNGSVLMVSVLKWSSLVIVKWSSLVIVTQLSRSKGLRQVVSSGEM